MRTLLLFTTALVAAAGGIDAPRIGYARSADGSVLQVSGVSGAFITTPTGLTDVVAAAFSGSLGLLKTNETTRVIDRTGAILSEIEAPSGPAMFGFDPTGRVGAAWYPSTGALAIYRDGEWSPAPFDPGASGVLAITLKDKDRAMVVLQSDSLSLVRIRLSDGAVEDVTALGASTGPVLALSDGSLIFQRDGAAILRDVQGVEQTLDLPAGVVELTPMGGAWVQARTDSGATLTVRLGSQPRVYILPAPSPVADVEPSGAREVRR